VKRFMRLAVTFMLIGLAGSFASAAFAQSEPSARFSLDAGNSVPGTDGAAQGPGGDNVGGADASSAGNCLPDPEIRRRLNRQGFNDAEIRRSLGVNLVEVRAVYGRWIYDMQVDRCTGQASQLQRIRRAMGGGLGLHFEYGGG